MLVLLKVVTSCSNKPTLIFLDVYSSHMRLTSAFSFVESLLLGIVPLWRVLLPFTFHSLKFSHVIMSNCKGGWEM